MNIEPLIVLTKIIAVREIIVESVRKIAPIARQTLQRSGTHSPTAILHTVSGFFPIVMSYENPDEKKEVVEFVKKEALEKNAYAVTTITNSIIIDCRSGAVKRRSYWRLRYKVVNLTLSCRSMRGMCLVMYIRFMK